MTPFRFFEYGLALVADISLAGLSALVLACAFALLRAPRAATEKAQTEEKGPD